MQRCSTYNSILVGPRIDILTQTQSYIRPEALNCGDLNATYHLDSKLYVLNK